MQVGEKWMKWTLLESVTKTASKVLQKIVGVVSTTFGHVFLVSIITALVQTIISFITARFKNHRIMAERRQIMWACLFGVMVTIGNIVLFSTFYYGGEIGTNTLILAMAIMPGALIDRIFFKHPLMRRQWLAVGIFILAS